MPRKYPERQANIRPLTEYPGASIDDIVFEGPFGSQNRGVKRELPAQAASQKLRNAGQSATNRNRHSDRFLARLGVKSIGSYEFAEAAG